MMAQTGGRQHWRKARRQSVAERLPARDLGQLARRRRVRKRRAIPLDEVLRAQLAFGTLDPQLACLESVTPILAWPALVVLTWARLS